ncbi:hypothetical protein J3Q64DRAFT_1758406 [Phycomyces blakesleeanus]|uniref:Uncharacterized protein n=2 Tax=Phycomyces blakesleeanus TaxID=4837 RepID=A0ABR3ASF7_PHYBL
MLPCNRNNGNVQDDCDGWRDKLVGKFILENDEATSLSSDEYVRHSDLPQPNRVLPPNSIMTMDYRPDRLNIRIDKTKRVMGVNYG